MMLFIKHWKFILHLLLGTSRFGVNNGWSVGFNSLFCRPIFGFGYMTLLRPWRWPAVWKVLKLRMEISGWTRS